MLIRRNGKAVSRVNLYNGEGEVHIEHLFLSDEFTVPVRLCARLTLEPGNSIGLHRHMEEDEIYFIVRGHGIAGDAGSETAVQAGDTILTRSGESHSLRNTGEEKMVLLAVIPQSPTS